LRGGEGLVVDAGGSSGNANTIMSFGNDGKENRGKLPPVVDLAFVSRVSHYGNGNERKATREGNFGQGPKR